ncbi:MAG: STAS/SEC14 domain-containing protein [Anaerolineales bacterium]|nr:STAS/SEC14 domain-containing protein [Anaerolineales bacterium]
MENGEIAIGIENKPDYLSVAASGKRSKETVKKLVDEAFRAAVERKYARILVDVRELHGPFGFLEIYYLVREVLQDLSDKGVNQVAVVDVRRTIGGNWFLETVAQNFGMNIRVFDNEESAINWFGIQA